MAKVINKSKSDGYYDPFTYGFSTPVSYNSTSGDKYVSSGNYNTETSELDLSVVGGKEVKISMSAITSGLTDEDEYVRSGESQITEDTQKLTLNIGDNKGLTKQVEVDLSGIGESFATKTELDNKLKWGEF